MRITQRLAKVTHELLVAGVCIALVVAGLATAVIRDRSQGATHRRTSRALSETQRRLATSEARAAKLTTDLSASTAKASALTGQLGGVRHSLTSTTADKEILKKCFRGFLDALEAASSGDRAAYDRIWTRIRPDCNKADNILY